MRQHIIESIYAAKSVLVCLYYTQELYNYFTNLLAGRTLGLESALRRFYLEFRERGNIEKLVCEVLKYLPAANLKKAHSAFSFLKDLLTALNQRENLIEQIFTITTEEIKICNVCQEVASK